MILGEDGLSFVCNGFNLLKFVLKHGVVDHIG